MGVVENNYNDYWIFQDNKLQNYLYFLFYVNISLAKNINMHIYNVVVKESYIEKW